MTVIRFEKVKLHGEKNHRCPGCGKKVRRQRTFWQTVSPFNRNAQGQPCTRQEVLEKVRKELTDWQAKPERCTPCADIERREADVERAISRSAS